MVNDLEELSCFRSEVPPPTSNVRESAKTALRNATIEEAVRASRHDGGGRTHRAVAALAIAALILAIVAAGATAMLLTGGATGRHQHGSTAIRLNGPQIRLDAYRFRLPAGYRARSSSSECMVSQGLQPGPAVTVLGSMAIAAAADGGCLVVELASGSASGPPADAQPAEVGPYRALLASSGDGTEALYVEIPASDGTHFLVLTSSDLSGRALIAIAASGLPPSAGADQPCSVACG